MTSSASDRATAPGRREVEAPVDLRLVPSALACWLACSLAVGSGWAEVLRAGAGLAACATVAAVVAWRAARARAARDRGARPHAPGPERAVPGLVLVLVVTAVALLGAAVQIGARERGPLAALAAERAVVTVEAVVRGDPVPVPSRWPVRADEQRVAVEVAVVGVSGRGRAGPGGAAAVVLGDARWAEVDVGTTVVLTGRSSPAAPGAGEIATIATWDPPTRVAGPGPVDRAVTRLRSSLLAVTDALPGDARGLVPGAAVGDTSRVPDDLDAAMRTAGLTHVTAVSGGHFAVLGVTVLALTAGLPRRVRAAVCAAVLTGFVLLVRPEPSVVRAAGMGAVALAGLALGRRSRAVPALSATVVLLLVVDPWLARSYGFVLSVVATAAIVLLAPPLARLVPGRVPRWAALAVAVPVAAQAACAPVLVLLDPGVSLYAVPANILAAPAMAPATLLGLATTVTAPWAPGSAAVLAALAAVPCRWVGAVARTAAGLDGARLAWPAGPAGAVLLAGATAVVLLLVLHPSARAARPWVAAVTAAALALAVPAVRAPLVDRLPGARLPAGWRVVQCDVGQGDALVVRTGQRSAVVVDVGPDGDAAGRCLDRLGVDRVDLLVMTHHHADHVGGLAAVLDGRDVVRALVSPLPEPAGQARRTLDALAAAGVPVDVGVAGAGDGAVGDGVPDGRGTSGALGWAVLWPLAHSVPAAADPSEGGAESARANDASLVLRLSSPDLDVVALGDVEPGAQAALRDAPGIGPADVVKVAHHGSAHQDPELAAVLSADVALIGVGEGNTYGHPAPTTVDLYRAAGGLVLATDRCGTVTVGGTRGRLEVWAACP